MVDWRMVKLQSCESQMQTSGNLTWSLKRSYDQVAHGEGVIFINPKQFLLVGGAVLLLVGILGFVGVIGPTPAKSLFGSFWYFDNSENLAHTVLGIAGLGAAFVLPALYQKYLVVLLGALGIVVGLYSLVLTAPILGANLENPADTVLHLVVGAWALYAAFGAGMMGGKKSASA